MTSFFESHNYYKKMLELQEKLRKSEEERIRLEERFKLLLQESRDRHNTCINRLRFRYIEFLEEQRTTDERNYKLLEALDRVDNSLALMTARTDRLNSLRKQYEAYLRRICTVRADGVDDMSGQQSSDKRSRTEQRNLLAPEVRSTLPLQSSWSNYQPIKSAFLSPSKAIKSTANISFDSSSPSTVDSKALGQRINDDQNVSQTCPKHLQRDFEQVPTFHLSSPAFRQSQTYNRNDRFEARDFQTDSKLQSPRVNALRAMPHLAMPCYINTIANKPLDISQSQTPQSLVQHPIDPPRMRSLPSQQCRTIPLDNLQRKPASGHFQNAPECIERNRSDASYLNYSSTDNEHDQNYITDSFLKYRNNVNAQQLSKGAGQTRLEEDEGKVSTTTDSEFDRYIDRIRKLHDDLDKQSLEEDRYRQDTNSDRFNATALNDGSDVSTMDKLDENLANKVKQVLELAENLVSRTMNMNDAKCVEQEEEAEQKGHQLRRSVQSCTAVSGRSHDETSDALEGRATSVAHANGRIRNDITLHQPELDSRKNMGNSKNPNSAGIDGDRAFEQRRERDLPESQNDDFVHASQDSRIYIADESELDQCLFGVSKDLEPWNLNSVEKQVKEIDLIDDFRDQTVEKDFSVAEPASNENKVVQVEDKQLDKHEARDLEPVQEDILNDANDALELQNNECFKVSETKDEDNEISATRLRASEKEDQSTSNTENNRLQDVELPNTEDISCNVESSNAEISIPENAELADGTYVEQKDYNDDDNNEGKYNDEPDVNEDNMPRNITLNEERGNQNYTEADHAKDSVRANDVEYSNSNEEYIYDRNESGEYDKKEEEHEGYANQECPQETIGQYEGYTDEHYVQYTNDPENAYENDSNAQYQEDTDQKYSYPYNEQYDDSNHEFAANENEQYEETKEIEAPQQRGDETKQECIEEYTDQQKESQNEEEEEEEDVLVKVDEDQLEKPPTINGKKKEKDVIKSLLDSDTDSTLEQNISNTESDFDFN